MCFRCGPLIKAIDAYIEKADTGLSEELGEEGYAEPEKTVRYIQEVEDGVAEALLEETGYILSEAEKAVDLEAFAEDVWPGAKLDDAVKGKLVKVFTESLEKFMPEFVGYYIAQTDRELKLEKVSERTAAWVRSWSGELGEIMKLNSHDEIERILEQGLKKGIGIEEFTRRILDSGIRDEHYKARRVAVTEVLTAHRAAQQEAFMQSPAVSEKMWKHTGAYRNRPRQNHVDMGGQRVPVGEPFELDGIKGGKHYPMFPGDPVLPPEERINCHCIQQPVVSRDMLGLPLEERKRLQQKAVDEMDGEWEKELDRKNRAKAGIDVEAYSTKVTYLYTGRASPGSGAVTYGEGYKKETHGREVEVAEFLHGTFGGDVELLPESREVGVKTPDFRWDGKLWELKTVTTEKSADSAVRSALHQIEENPGGVILDYGANGISVQKLRDIITSRFKRSGCDVLDVMVLTKDRTVAEVYRYKK